MKYKNSKQINRRSVVIQNLKNKEVQMKVKRFAYRLLQVLALIGMFYVVCMMPETCHASVESSLIGIRTKLTGFVLPVLSVCGLLFAAFSFFTGQESAKQHILYAVIGCGIGFGAQAIVDFIAQTVN